MEGEDLLAADEAARVVRDRSSEVRTMRHANGITLRGATDLRGRDIDAFLQKKGNYILKCMND